MHGGVSYPLVYDKEQANFYDQEQAFLYNKEQAFFFFKKIKWKRQRPFACTLTPPIDKSIHDRLLAYIETPR